MGYFTGRDLLWSQLAVLNAVEILDREFRTETQEVLLTNVVRKELGDLAEFMFHLQQPEEYAKWKDRLAEEVEEEVAADTGGYEYVELDDMSPDDFAGLVGKLNQLPLESEGGEGQPDFAPLSADEEEYDGDYFLG